MSRTKRPNAQPHKPPQANNITPGHVRAFHMVTSQLYDNVTLWSCTIDGEPGVAIVLVDQPSPSQLSVMPLFVAINGKMKIEFDGEQGDGETSEGPARYDVLRDLETPAPTGAD